MLIESGNETIKPLLLLLYLVKHIMYSFQAMLTESSTTKWNDPLPTKLVRTLDESGSDDDSDESACLGK